MNPAGFACSPPPSPRLGGRNVASSSLVADEEEEPAVEYEHEEEEAGSGPLLLSCWFMLFILSLSASSCSQDLFPEEGGQHEEMRRLINRAAIRTKWRRIQDYRNLSCKILS